MAGVTAAVELMGHGIIVHPMWVLALDTTTAAGSAALAEGTRVLEVAALDPTQPVATRVPRDLIAILERHAVQLAQINLFAVATGPGSFTGLRIGIAAMQGLALAEGKPLVGVSTFEALASLATPRARLEGEARVTVWIDAWRGEVYAATWAHDAVGDVLRMVGEPTVDHPDALLATSAASDALFVGDGAVRYRDRLRRVVQPTPLVAGAVASIARARAEAGECPPPHAIRPLYVRRPDAELAAERRKAADGAAR